jgi:CRP/FNR family transcriptional regulator, polysaccharide utilization system transcription regulator
MHKAFCKICVAEACVNHCILFDNLNDEEIAIIQPECEIAYFKRKDQLPVTGFSTAHIVYICHGYAKIYIDSPYRKKFLLEILGRERFIASSLTDFGHSLTSVTALTDLKICYFAIKDIMMVAEKNPSFGITLLKQFNINSTNRFQRMASIAIKHTRGRLADALLYIYHNFKEINLYDLISRKDLAELANISNENAIRTLSDFEEECVILTENRSLEIIDMDALVKISQRG